MNQTKLPSLFENATAAGLVFETTEASESITDHKALEIACVELICKLENLLAKAKASDKDEFVDESGKTARKMLSALAEFSGEFFSDKAKAQAREEIDKAISMSHAYEEVLKTRSWGVSIIRTFWNIEESKEIKDAHTKLGESLARACTATFYHAIRLIGLESSVCQEIDQSTLLFVNELKQTW